MFVINDSLYSENSMSYPLKHSNTAWLFTFMLSLDHTVDLEDKEFFDGAESKENYDDMASFFAEFNAANDGFKEAQNAERVPTMETHGYVLEES